MATYVLVHGAWQGGWSWRRVADRLRAAGHDVFTPTLSGIGERAHQATPKIGLRAHVTDLVAMLRYEDLRDVVLVGHSYGGFVVREAADQAPERIARIVMVDAWAGRDGESLDDRATRFFRDWLDSVTVDGMVPPPPLESLGVSEPTDQAFLRPRLTPQPRLTFAEPTRLTGTVDLIPTSAVVCVPGGGIPFGQWAEEFGWPTLEIETGHNAMVTAPDALTEALQKPPASAVGLGKNEKP
ncbi:alpha/beta fold hydrolase [Streptoalloteichus hindustanus]|uniref:Alpha/beta hydrolase family protein n=1 Tax=Streptoalloteichus hindustanus TaxID=2017 RepID=A0A1M5FS58_STRHI|nr:alpha/beta fold hydrolase [Streptoalloteichus hindustanus]SHF94380.1 Alpha/beta hydrolase family protein [Streptoalloteichus hindustanus]